MQKVVGMSTGDYILLLGDDDLFTPHFLNKIGFLSQNPAFKVLVARVKKMSKYLRYGMTCKRLLTT
jgi:hypothetical protein